MTRASHSPISNPSEEDNMQGNKKPVKRAGKFDRVPKPAHQLGSFNVCVEQVVRALVALELWTPDFSEPQLTLWDVLSKDGTPVDFVRIADVEVRGKDDAVLRMHPRQVTFCALLGVRAREVVAYLTHMKEQVPGEPERDAITVLSNPNKPGFLTAHASLAAVYAAVRAVLGIDKELQHGTN
jgi:hypothetical protein